MGPLLLSGLAVFGATVAIGTIAASTRVPVASRLPVPPSRRLAVVVIAIAGGCGVIGVAVGLLAVVLGVPVDPASTPVMVILAIAGALVGLAQILRNSGGLDPWIVPRAATFIGSLAVLAVAIAILAAVIPASGGGSPPAWAFLVLGSLGAGGSIGIGIVSRRPIQDSALAEDAAAPAVMSTSIARIVPFEIVAVGSSMVALALITAS